MYRPQFGFHSTMWLWLFLAGFLGNVFWLHSPVAGAILLAAFLVFLGGRIGAAAAPDDPPSNRLWLGVWLLLSSVMVVGTAIYDLHSFPKEAAIVLVILGVPIAWWLGKHAHADLGIHDVAHENRHHVPAAVLTAACVALLGFTVTFRFLAATGTFAAIASPWRVVPSAAFVGFGAGLLALAALWHRGRERALVAGLTALALGVFLSVNLTVFPLGAGFDSFIHRATESRIVETGSVTPKPLYYVGQYTLVAFLSHAFSIPVDLADRFLLPVLALCLLAFAWLNAAEHLIDERRRAPFTYLGLFLLPIGAFATTTPQGLANLWILLLILAAVPFLKRLEHPRVYALALPALAALTIHPIAGLPALLFIAYLACDPAGIPKRWQTIGAWIRRLIVVGGAVLLPASFLVASRGLNSRGLDLANLGAKLGALFPVPPAIGAPFRSTLDFAVVLGWLAGWIVLGLALLGWKSAAPRVRHACAAMAGLLLANYVLLVTVIDFSFLIDYERLNYAERLLPLILFFLAPLAIVGLGVLHARLASAPRSVRWFAIALSAATVLGLWYAAYPRDDAYLKGHGYNVSAADLHAVRAIEEDAGKDAYLGLANQSVSAAAISTIGFRYFGDQFFYPIPTGGDLYARFLDMNTEPTSTKALDAIKLVEDNCHAQNLCEYGRIKHLYFVVNSYWWDATHIADAARATAQKELIIDDGAIRVFRYDR